ncbi:hypothetical protein Aca07nite_52170 [Actinoplanes capillaceus]|uniref:DUF1232 domain-containing protein n=1 Tax=Actinoplanes campanulatus TaxID=113559 RepID=A0ABQ3WNZ3_9ACTN|nr:hypothetical protein [Actinoplanes capillaceus]GID47942.1 hypothetical protein Aca07nite_52170 [Actinoplanes capillaceus]
MRTLWDREMQAEVESIESMASPARLELARRVIAWTVSVLPVESAALLDSDAGEWVRSAVRMIDAAAEGLEVSEDDVDEIEDELLELADDMDYVPLWQLFNGLVYAVGVSSTEMGGQTTVEILSACYDVVRDCEDLPESVEPEAEEVVLAREMANDRCRAAIERQRAFVREAGV